jgi:hypothetical protein
VMSCSWRCVQFVVVAVMVVIYIFPCLSGELWLVVWVTGRSPVPNDRRERGVTFRKYFGRRPKGVVDDEFIVWRWLLGVCMREGEVKV